LQACLRPGRAARPGGHRALPPGWRRSSSPVR
jgi:hypothetical protein